MTDTFRTIIVPAPLAPLARSLAGGLSDRGSGMFTVGLSPTGSQPATHYVSTGMIDDSVAALLADSARLYAACNAAGAPVTMAQCSALVSQSDVSADEPFAAFARTGLKLVRRVI